MYSPSIDTASNQCYCFLIPDSHTFVENRHSWGNSTKNNRMATELFVESYYRSNLLIKLHKITFGGTSCKIWWKFMKLSVLLIMFVTDSCWQVLHWKLKEPRAFHHKDGSLCRRTISQLVEEVWTYSKERQMSYTLSRCGGEFTYSVPESWQIAREWKLQQRMHWLGMGY